MSVPLRVVQWMFRRLYTTFAFLYDFVATVVSFGEWRDWGYAAIDFAQGLVLEVGHGPGHVMLRLVARRIVGTGPVSGVVGIDLSQQMARHAAAKLHRAGQENVSAQADASSLPFPDRKFDTVISTFPAPYIFELATLQELNRVLNQHGHVVVVPHAKLVGAGIWAGLLRALYAITGQRLAAPDRVRARVAQAGFALDVHTRRTRHAEVTLWLLRKIA